MNVYEMYAANGNRAGFWIQRDSWGRTCAVVRSVAGQSEGELPGKPPYHGNPPVIVDVFDLRDGTPKDSRAALSCPGTHGYERIDPPAWASAG